MASGFPQPTYTWSKDNQLVVPDHNRLAMAGGNLLLRSTMIQDVGKYTCVATNKFGSSSSTVILTVNAPLSAHVEPAEQTIDVGEEAVFNCTVYGNPVSSVRWFKDGELVEGNARVYFPTRQSLRVRSVQRGDRGMYQCIVSNDEDDEAQGTAQLELGGKFALFFKVFSNLHNFVTKLITMYG